MQAEAGRARPEHIRPIIANLPERRALRRSWFAPLAAGLAIATTMAGVAAAVQATGILSRQRTGSESLSSTFSKPPWPSADHRMPDYYVTINMAR